MNIYDPADCIVYLHMPRRTDPDAVPVERTRTSDRLPTGLGEQVAPHPCAPDASAGRRALEEDA